MYGMPDHRSIDLRLLGALGARGGSASPRELREAVGLPPRTFTRTLGRLDAAGLLAERSKGTVTLSASAWLLLQKPAEPKRPARRTDAPAVIHAWAPFSSPETRREPERRPEQPDEPWEPDDEPGAVEEPDGQLDVDADEPAYEDEPDELLDADARRPGFIDGLLRGLSG
jgi:DNA-binding transcriptional ArsR family regulator